MTFRKYIAYIHLWLGLFSGLVVFIVGVTGCCYVFVNEIEEWTAPQRKVVPENRPFLQPSELREAAQKQLGGGRKVSYLSYEPGKSVYMGAYGEGYSYGLFLNPYSGELLDKKDYLHEKDLFGWILHGHRALWLPYEIGRPVVDTGVFLFILLLLSGLMLWWPGKWNKNTRKKSFTVKWKASWKRLNYDLHNVPGFYALLVLLILALTGSVYGFSWFSKALYYVTSRGKTLPAYKAPLSDTTQCRIHTLSPVDQLWKEVVKNGYTQAFSISFPGSKSDAIQFSVNPKPGTQYQTDQYAFDQYTLKPVKGEGTFARKYIEASFADRLNRMNYDLHTGAIGGLTTKILAFSASLIAASLPITGFFIWMNRQFKKNKKRVRKRITNRG